ncbi:chemotaxis protein CheA [Synechococcus sp. CBW1108]|uniref:chemotaxis protein CheA n=1 Tax=Synechococcus sp. CBW1108 TaxID=1353147 RepID=UPI0018CF6F0E|nr:chemotaxis protein CheA [Synechococcus sp. CBW1108]QPN71192.1 chemotaxis protein CheA [Synechococcus sp. CBW1108]
MALLDESTEELLQEIALELAFVQSGGQSSIAALITSLGKLQQIAAAQGREKALQLSRELGGWLVELEARGTALDAGELEALQQKYQPLEKALYAEANKTEAGFTINLESQDDLELLNEFCNEGKDLLSQVEQGVLVLEEDPAHRETLNQVFRAFHTFKGGAGFLGLEPIKDLAHNLESLLDAARQNSLVIDRHVINLILAGGDALRKFVDGIEQTIRSDNKTAPIIVPTRELIERVRSTLDGNPGEVTVEKPGETSMLASEPPSEPANEAKIIPPIAEINKPIPATAKEIEEPQTKPSPKPKAANLSNFVKIDTQKLDALIDLVGELVIAKSMVVEHPVVAGQQSEELSRELRQLSRIAADLQRNAMSLRMVPIRTTFQKMNRLVRDLANSQNKQICLVTKGEDTELDRNIVEALAEPMIHMLRNSIDHGIEHPAEREGLGKSAAGKIEIEACHQAGGILIRIEDDGRGIDPARVLAKARERGIVDTDFNGNTNEILSLIFEPGFSTAETVTDVSGRGVGMDVVRGSISRLRGRIDVQSVVGKSTTFSIYLPLTLAIIDGMLVGAGNQRFIIPTLSIQESFKPTASMLSTLKGRGQLVNLRGRLIPMISLCQKLKIDSGSADPSEGIILIINSGGQAKGLLVDHLISKQEVVIKPMGETLQSQPVYSGAAIMGDGRVALILDPDALGRSESPRTESPSLSN